MAIENWLDMYGMTQEVDKVCKEKPPAIAHIDDRAICFDGHPETLLKKIQNFQPWYKTPTLTPQNEPLTIEQLREMDGEPVWVELHQAWALVEVKQNGSVMFYGNSFSCSYSRTWQVYRFRPYRRPPEGEEDA